MKSCKTCEWGQYWARGDFLCLHPYEDPEPSHPCDRWTDNPDAIATWTKQTLPQFFMTTESLSKQNLRLAQQKLSDGFTDEALAIAEEIAMNPDNEDLIIEALTVVAIAEEAAGSWVSALSTWSRVEAAAILQERKGTVAYAISQQASNLAAIGAFDHAIAKLDEINIADAIDDLKQDIAVLKHRCKIWAQSDLAPQHNPL